MNGLERINELKRELVVVRGGDERLQLKLHIADLLLMLDLDELERLVIEKQHEALVSTNKEPIQPAKPAQKPKSESAQKPKYKQVKEEHESSDDTSEQPEETPEPIISETNETVKTEEVVETEELEDDLDPIEQYEKLGVQKRFTEAERGWLREGVFCKSADVREKLLKDDGTQVGSQAITNLKNRGILNYEKEEGSGNCDYYRWSVLLRKYRIPDLQAQRKLNEGTT